MRSDIDIINDYIVRTRAEGWGSAQEALVRMESNINPRPMVDQITDEQMEEYIRESGYYDNSMNLPTTDLELEQKSIGLAHEDKLGSNEMYRKGIERGLKYHRDNYQNSAVGLTMDVVLKMLNEMNELTFSGLHNAHWRIAEKFGVVRK